jgi:hypothetical protein
VIENYAVLLTEAEQLACPVCGAKAGEQCRPLSEQSAGLFMHARRVYQ